MARTTKLKDQLTPAAFSRWLRARMKERGLTQVMVASRLRVTQQAVSLWICAEKLPGERNFERILKMFSVRPHEFWDTHAR